MSTVFRTVGNTIFLSANATSSNKSISVAGGPLYFKVDNINNANVDAFINFGSANTTSAIIANATASSQSVICQHNDTIYVQYGTPYDAATTLYVAAITSTGTANLYITPVAVVS
jgi:hypothetical protein